jgi:hypothetical protein
MGSLFYSLFRVSLPPPRKNAPEGFYIGFLGQPRQSEIKTDVIEATRLKRA